MCSCREIAGCAEARFFIRKMTLINTDIFIRPLLVAGFLFASGWSVRAEDNTITTIDGITVDNAGADYVVGNTGTNNTLTITNRGELANVSLGTIGNNASANNNAALVTGIGSRWDNTGVLTVGNYGAGNSLTIADMGWVDSTGGSIGYNTGANYNTVTVSGDGAVWNSQGAFTVGGSGDYNTMTIDNGGEVDSTGGSIGYTTDANNNTVRVTGFNSRWLNSVDLTVGASGSGNLLVIDGGGSVGNASGAIGYNHGAGNNSVEVSGSGSTWNNNSGLAVGLSGSGNKLTIDSGGAVNSGFSTIGSDTAANNNAVTVNGPGAIWNNTGALTVGYRGSHNTMTIGNGGAVNAGGNLTISASDGTSGNAVNISYGQLAVTNGTLTVNGAGDTGSGALNISGGAVLVKQLTAASTNAVITFNGGTINSHGTTVSNGLDFIVGDTSGNATFIANGGTHSFQNNLVVGNAGYDNSLTITNNGTLAVTNAAGNGTLDVRNGTLTLKSGTIVADQFYITNGASSTLAIELHSVNSNVVLTVGGSALLGGALNVAAPNGFKPALSNAFTILTAQTVTGAFAFTNLPPLGDAFAWSVTYAPTSVVLSVVNGTSPYALWAQARIPDLNQRNSDQNADSDAYSNWQEYIADTDPTNPASYFQLVAVSNLPPLRVYFLASSNRQYTMNWCSNLVYGAWTNVPGQGPRSGAGVVDWMQDTNLLPAEFYRIDVQLP